MNCCKNNDNKLERNQGDMQTHKNNHAGHMKMMAICCGTPILLILILPLFGYKGFLLNIIPFICPIMMVLMMPMMMLMRKCKTSKDKDNTTIESIENK